jgi:AraC-like DNA-binding protein
LHSQQDLQTLTYKQLQDSISKHGLTKHLADVYIKKAKKEQNNYHIAYGYEYMTRAVSLKDALIYCDSLVPLSHKISHKNYPALGYLFKGEFLYKAGRDKEALDNYLIAYKYANQKNNIVQKNNIMQFIASIKLNLGQYEDALKIFLKERERITSLPNYKQEHTIDYIYNLDDLTSVYLRAKMLDSAEVKIKEGIHFSKQTKDRMWYNEFLANSAFHLYFKNELNRALDSFQKVESLTKLPIDLSVYYYYQGKIYQKLNNTDLSIDYFNKVDSLYVQYKNPHIELKEVYKTLYEHHYEHDNKYEQLQAIEKLIEVDSIFDELSINVNSKSISDYELPDLKKEKEKLLEDLNKEHTKTNYIIASATLIALVLVLVLIKLYTDKKQLKARFESIIQKQGANSKSVLDKTIEAPSEKIENTLNISQEVIDAILEALTQFEHNKGYLDNQITLAFLAKQFSTNSVYLSKVINHYKDMSLSNYLSNLRIKYCITELRENSTLRNYTIKAIALEMGFRNAESFSKAFKKQTGLNPSYYIKSLNKLEENS